jgi:hypothetical protein
MTATAGTIQANRRDEPEGKRENLEEIIASRLCPLIPLFPWTSQEKKSFSPLIFYPHF